MNREESSTRNINAVPPRRPSVLGRLQAFFVAVWDRATAQLYTLLQVPLARTVMIVIAVLVIDCLIPLGLGVSAFYMAAVLSAVPIRHPKAVYYTAALCSVLALLRWAVPMTGSVAPEWKILMNRAVGIAVIWAAAGMADAWNRLQQRRLKQVQEARLLHQATMLSASQVSFRKALENSLHALCETLGWPVGHVYLRDVEGRFLVSSDIWWTAQEERFDLLRAAARGLRFAPGEGIPGRIWQEGEPITVADVSDAAEYDWLKEPTLLGVHGAFALPITVGGETAAVLEFFSGERVAVDFEFAPLARNIGEQLGRLFERRRADENLRRSEERLRLALQGGGMGIWEWNLDTGRVVWSPELERIHGLEPGAFEGTLEAVQREVHPEDRQRVAEAVQHVMEGGGDYRVEYRMIRPDGTVRWLEGRGAMYADTDGQPRRMAGVCMDITERKDAEVRNARLAAIVQSSDDAIVGKGLDGTILNWNAGAERIYGYTADEIVGKTVYILTPEGQPDETRAIMERIARGERVEHYETLRRRKDGRLITISLTVSPIVDADGNVIAASSVARDVTEKKRIERLMNEALEKAETANRLQSRFLANMSHELRTPMNSVLGMLQLALDSDVPPEVRRWLSTARISADALLMLLNDLLDYSKIEAGKLMIQSGPFRLRELLEQTAQSLAMKAFEKGVELLVDVDPDIPDRVTGDAGRLRQVLTNLLTNAVKFTDAGEVAVAVNLVERSEDRAVVRFSVSDTGAGISPGDQKRVFEPFIQSDATASQQLGGAGLGLAIARELVRRMGGEIELESELGEGSRFWFSLPLAMDEDAALEEMEPRYAELPVGVRVLVVDDNAPGRDLLVKLLSRWSMTAEAAIDCDHAVGKLQRAEAERHSYRLILIDAAMLDDGNKTLPACIRGGLAEPPAVIRMRAPGPGGVPETLAGVDVEKPVSPARLLQAVARAIGIAPADAGTEPGRTRTALVSPPLAVLVAEDVLANQEVAACALRRRGHAVTVVANGREAVDLVARQSFDVVLMDVTMPVMDGYDATVAIRESEARSGRHVPIIALTAHATRDVHERCAAAGMDAYLSKPVDVARLAETVETIARKARSHQRPLVTAESGSEDSHNRQAALVREGEAFALQEADRESLADVIDYRAALARLGGDNALFRRMIELFDEDAPGLLRTAGEAVSAGDPARLHRAAHSLKGLAANFSAEDAVEQAMRLEEMGRSGQLENAQPAVAALALQFDRLHRALAPYRHGPVVEPAVPEAT